MKRPKSSGKNHWNWKKKIEKKCVICGKLFYIIPSRNQEAKLCSMKCHGIYSSQIGKKTGFGKWNKGRKISKENREKMSNALKEKYKNGFISPFKGKPAWNKGTKGLIKPNSGSFKKGQVSSKPMLGKKHSEETRKKMKEIHKKIWQNPEYKKRMSEIAINNPNRVFKNTSIELKIEEELQSRNINYQKQIPLCNVTIVDFYLPEYRIVIQCDGDYWHNLPGCKEKDDKQNKVLIFNGFNVYRFWEKDIKKSPKNCINQLNL